MNRILHRMGIRIAGSDPIDGRCHWVRVNALISNISLLSDSKRFEFGRQRYYGVHALTMECPAMRLATCMARCPAMKGEIYTTSYQWRKKMRNLMRAFSDGCVLITRFQRIGLRCFRKISYN